MGQVSTNLSDFFLSASGRHCLRRASIGEAEYDKLLDLPYTVCTWLATETRCVYAGNCRGLVNEFVSLLRAAFSCRLAPTQFSSA